MRVVWIVAGRGTATLCPVIKKEGRP